MVDTIGRCATPKENIENLLRAKQMHFPDQLIDWGLGIGDWGYLLEDFIRFTVFIWWTTLSRKNAISLQGGSQSK